MLANIHFLNALVDTRLPTHSRVSLCQRTCPCLLQTRRCFSAASALPHICILSLLVYHQLQTTSLQSHKADYLEVFAGNHEEESEFRYGDDYLDTFDCENSWDIPAPLGGNDHTQCAMSYRFVSVPASVPVPVPAVKGPCLSC